MAFAVISQFNNVASLGTVSLLSEFRKPLGGSHYRNAAVSTTAVAAVAPGTNTNGLVLRRAIVYAAGSYLWGLFADTAAPTAVSDLTKRLLAMGATGGGVPQMIDFNVLIPAGRGVYLITASGSIEVVFDYDIL